MRIAVLGAFEEWRQLWVSTARYSIDIGEVSSMSPCLCRVLFIIFLAALQNFVEHGCLVLMAVCVSSSSGTMMKLKIGMPDLRAVMYTSNNSDTLGV